MLASSSMACKTLAQSNILPDKNTWKTHYVGRLVELVSALSLSVCPSLSDWYTINTSKPLGNRHGFS